MPPTFVKHFYDYQFGGPSRARFGGGVISLQCHRGSLRGQALSGHVGDFAPPRGEAPRGGQNLGRRNSVTRIPRLAGLAEAERGTRGR